MIQLTPQMRIFVANEPINMKNGIDGISAICRLKLGSDPMSGALFVFTNRTRKMIRILVYDGQGFWLMTKRLSVGRFPYWLEGSLMTCLTAEQLYVLLRGGNPRSVEVLGEWRKVSWQ